MTARSPLGRSTLASSTCIPMTLDKETHDRVLNWAAVMMWPQFAESIRKQVGNSIINLRDVTAKARQLGVNHG